ncbi:MAG: DNA polymerase III subunit delta' [Caldimonas sp.]
MSKPDDARVADDSADIALPWLATPLRDALATRHAHALLVQGPGRVGQFELALALAAAWLCEDRARPLVERPCGQCAGCRLIAARSHPDLLVLVPEAMRESLGLSGGGGEGEEGADGSKRKPSKEIRVEAVRAATAFATTTSARGRGKVVVVHPAERMNPIAANAFLKTLEEPVGDSRFLLCTADPESLLPTIRSRCQLIALGTPEIALAEAWLVRHDVDSPAVLLAGSGGQPQEALEWAANGIDASAWQALPRRIARGETAALRGWPLAWAVAVLQKICHDAAALAFGAEPRYFPRQAIPAGADLDALLRAARELRRFAAEAEHPWSSDLALESLVEQTREALKTPRSPGREGKALSVNSAR